MICEKCGKRMDRKDFEMGETWFCECGESIDVHYLKITTVDRI